MTRSNLVTKTFVLVKAKIIILFFVESLQENGNTNYTDELGHMTKMTVMSIYSTNL